MSDPVQNSEVEDVLSSIRRLVSEDKRPLQAPKIDKPAPKSEPANERLVLTPALRVGENAAPDAPQHEAASDAPPPRRRETFADLVTDDTLLDVYPHKETAAPEDVAERPEPEAATTSVDQIAADYSTDPYNFEEDEVEADAVVVSSASVKAEQSDTETAEAVEVETEPQIDATPATDQDIDPVNPVSATEEDDDLSDDTDIVAEVTDTEPAGSHSLSAKIEALETAISNISDTWEPDDPGDSDYAGTEAEAMEWEDDEPQEDMGRATFIRSTTSLAAAKGVSDAPSASTDEPEEEASEPKPVFAHKAEETNTEMAGTDTIEHGATSETAQPAEGERVEAAATNAQQPADDPGLTFDEDEQLIDEDALRDLVSEIVREELQGALGERITRNVRKLVRREIHRALTAQELE